MDNLATIEEKIKAGEVNLLVDEMHEDTAPLMEKTRNPQDGVLLRVRGPFGEVDRKNKNGRYYSTGLWEGVLGNKDIAKKIKERGCFGEATHPQTFNAEFPRVSHVLTDLWIGKDDGQLYGEADILDTPAGRIMDVLYRAKCKVGISSRGAGSTVKRKGREEVNEKDYRFAGFDFVTDPSAHNAYPTMAEEFKKEIQDVLTESAKEVMESPEAQSSFCNLLESIGCTDADTLGKCGLSSLTEHMTCPCEDDDKEAIIPLNDNKISIVAKKLTEKREETEEASSDNDTGVDSTTLNEATEKVTRLEEANQSLQDELESTKAQLKTFMDRLAVMESDYRDLYLRSQNTTLDEGAQEESPDSENLKLEGLKAENEDLEKQVADLTEIQKNQDLTIKSNEETVKALKEEHSEALKEWESKVSKIEESIKVLEEDKRGLQERLVELKCSVADQKEENKSLYIRFLAERHDLDTDVLKEAVEGLTTRAQLRSKAKLMQEELIQRRTPKSLGPLPTFEGKQIVKVMVEDESKAPTKKRLKKIIKNV